jgi:hypothetical protein
VNFEKTKKKIKTKQSWLCKFFKNFFQQFQNNRCVTIFVPVHRAAEFRALPFRLLSEFQKENIVRRRIVQ